MSGDLEVETAGPIRRLTLARPAKLNALTRSLRAELTDAVLSADADPAVSVIVLAGAGDRAFCSGIDLSELADEDDQVWRGPYQESAKAPWQVLAEITTPTIGSVNGLAIGGGFELVLACDLVVAVGGVEVGLPEARLGLAASFASAQLVRRVPHGVASDLLFTGALRPIDELARWGLVYQLVALGDLRDITDELANRVAANAPLSLRRMKATMTKGITLPLMSAVTLDSGPDPYTSKDRLEGVSAWRERRQPRWTGR